MHSIDSPNPERFDVDHWAGKLFLLLVVLIVGLFWGIVILAILM